MAGGDRAPRALGQSNLTLRSASCTTTPAKRLDAEFEEAAAEDGRGDSEDDQMEVGGVETASAVVSPAAAAAGEEAEVAPAANSPGTKAGDPAPTHEGGCAGIWKEWIVKKSGTSPHWSLVGWFSEIPRAIAKSNFHTLSHGCVWCKHFLLGCMWCLKAAGTMQRLCQAATMRRPGASP